MEYIYEIYTYLNSKYFKKINYNKPIEFISIIKDRFKKYNSINRIYKYKCKIQIYFNTKYNNDDDNFNIIYYIKDKYIFLYNKKNPRYVIMNLKLQTLLYNNDCVLLIDIYKFINNILLIKYDSESRCGLERIVKYSIINGIFIQTIGKLSDFNIKYINNKIYYQKYAIYKKQKIIINYKNFIFVN